MEHKLSSGAILEITVAPFAEAHALLKSILKSVKGSTFNGIDPATDISRVFEIATSEEVEKCLFKCFERVTYDNMKLTRDLFDAPNLGDKIREDYFTICSLVIDANCKPFFKQTFSASGASAQTAPLNQK